MEVTLSMQVYHEFVTMWGIANESCDMCIAYAGTDNDWDICGEVRLTDGHVYCEPFREA
jgi:hypothetical protein